MLSRITRQDIYRLVSGRDNYIRGHNLYTKGCVVDFSSDGGASGEMEVLTATVAETASKLYPVKVFVELGTNRIIKHSCRCNHHIMWRGACDHVIATLLYMADDEHPAAATLSADIVRAFESAYMAELDTYGGSLGVRLYPRFRVDSASLTFSIGRSRLYILKDVDEFLDNVKYAREVRYGRDLHFKHSLKNFDEASVRMIKLMRRITGAMHDAAELVPGFYTPFKFRKNLPIIREFVDDFFAIYKDSSINIELGGRDFFARVTDEPPDMGFTVRYIDGLPVINAAGSEFYTVTGRRCGYFIGESIHRVDRVYVKTVVPLVKAIHMSHGDGITVRRENLHSFTTVILPVLIDLGAVVQGEHQYAPEPLECIAYLDYVSEAVVCGLIFKYGEIEINPLSTEACDVSRDGMGEYRMKAFMESAGFTAAGTAYTLNNSDDMYEFYSTGLARMRELAQVFTTDEFVKKSYMPPASKTGMGVRFKGNLIELDLGDTGYKVSELIEALESYRVKKKYHRLTDGRFVDLTAVGERAEVLSAFEISKKDVRANSLRLPKYRAIYLNSILDRQGNAVKTPEFNSMVADFDNIGGYAIPAAMEGVLREYQKIGYEWLRTLAAYKFGGILADEMGLGKTIQVIALILADHEKSSVVVAPTSLMYNWEREFSRFAPEVKAVVVSGTPQRRKELLQTQADVFITTYDTLKRDIDNYSGLDFKYVIADEAQYMKNPATQNASAVKELSAEARFALTGTPIENSLSELWSIFDFIMPGYLYSPGKFSRFFETPIIKHGDEGKSAELRKQIAPFVLRRMKRDVLAELPEKVETNLYAEMSEEQRRLYTAHLLKARGEIDAANPIEVLALLTRLRQICCHPALFAEGYTGGSGKLDLAVDTIVSATESGHRVLLFSQFTSMLGILMEALREADISYFYLDGRTPASERLGLAERFNAGESEVFVISLKAGGTGLNLTGADVVIHYDPWWNPAVMDQAADRAHRYGQDKVVQVINIVTRDSIEERVLKLQEQKKGLVDSVITEGGNFLNRMTAQEILELFKE